MSKRIKAKKGFHLDPVLSALDLVVAEHQYIIGPDFIITPNDPLNADIGHLDPKALRTFDQKFIDMLTQTKSSQSTVIPENLSSLSKHYWSQRQLLSNFYDRPFNDFIEYDIEASKELGNFDPYIEKVVIRNDAERNVFFDYLLLYRKMNGKRGITDWLVKNKDAINPKNKILVSALEKSRFSVLRLDRNLGHGAILVTNVITAQEHLLIDRALHDSKKEGLFFICTALDMQDYIMTSGGGAPIDPKSNGGRSVLTLMKKHWNKLQKASRPINNDILSCVREVYGFCLRSGALAGMTVK